jgi:hypothetical protein
LAVASFWQNAVAANGAQISPRVMRPNVPPSGILDAFNRLDRDSIYRRFFRLKKELTATELQQLTQDDTGQVVALVATTQTEDGELLMAVGVLS